MISHTSTLNSLLPTELPTQISASIDAIKVTGVAVDSRQLKVGDLFLAVPGTVNDGRNFIDQAILAGASAVLVDSTGEWVLDQRDGVPVLALPDLAKRMAEIVAKYYQYPSQTLRVFGVTGTNGKTSCSHYLAQMLELLGESCGVMGTLGCGFINNLQESLNTTADAVTTQRFMAEMVEAHVPNLSMEVSSHGLAQGRTDAIHFDTAIFTNLTHDHLDYHLSMEEYARAKSRLFASHQLRYAVINEDDRYEALMKAQLRSGVEVVGFSLREGHGDISVSQIHYHAGGMQAVLSTPWGSGQLSCSLLGGFNLANVLAVIGALGLHGYPLTDLLNAVARLQPVDGRMQLKGGQEKPLVIVDYAHTPDALESLLSAVALHASGNIICVFGCGGDRDKSKRPLMAQAAISGAQKVIVTSDNPRTESPDDIIADILQGVSAKDSDRIDAVTDRAAAIQSAFACAGQQDIIVVAGKGHETYQEINGVRHAFNDVDVVENCLRHWQGAGV